MAKAVDQDDLGTFDGFTVDMVRMKVTKAGDGLSKSLAANGENGVHRKGERVAIVLEGVIGTVSFPPDKEHDDRVIRLEELVTETITIVEHGLVADIIDDQRQRNDAHAEEVRLARTKQPRLTDGEVVASSADLPGMDDSE